MLQSCWRRLWFLVSSRRTDVTPSDEPAHSACRRRNRIWFLCHRKSLSPSTAAAAAAATTTSSEAVLRRSAFTQHRRPGIILLDFRISGHLPSPHAHIRLSLSEIFRPCDKISLATRTELVYRALTDRLTNYLSKWRIPSCWSSYFSKIIRPVISSIRRSVS